MEIVNRVSRMSSLSAKLVANDVKVGLVPTKGGMHPGHVGLIHAARKMSDLVIVSIFVNRTGFPSEEEYAHYPRDLTKDIDLLCQENVDYVFAPPEDEMFPPGFGTFVQVEECEEKLSGLSRDVMFRINPTSTLKLIQIIRPTFFFLGQKDAIQGAVLRKMIRDLHLNTEVVLVPVLRDTSGLAYGVRNQYLRENERAAATVVYKSLQAASGMIMAGESQTRKILGGIAEVIEAEPLARLQYVVALDPASLEPLAKIQGDALITVGVAIGKVLVNDSLMVGKDLLKAGLASI